MRSFKKQPAEQSLQSMRQHLRVALPHNNSSTPTTLGSSTSGLHNMSPAAAQVYIRHTTSGWLVGVVVVL
jgi:hypothetical protein